MNIKPIFTHIFGFALLVTLASCVTVEINYPDEGIGAENNSASQLATRTEPSVTPVIPLLHEEFDNPSSLYGYDPQLWNCWECEGIVKGNNVVRFDKSTGWNSILVTKSKWQFKDVNFLQSRFRIIDGKGDIRLALLLGSHDIGWDSVCGLDQISNEFFYSCHLTNENDNKYHTEAIPVRNGDWYTAKMEIDHQTQEIIYYLDDTIIGKHVVGGFNSLEKINLWFHFGVSLGSHPSNLVAEFDNILLAQYP